jgi:elongation factor P
MIDGGQLKKGDHIGVDGQIFQVVDYHHLGRGYDQIRLRLRDIKTDRTVEKVARTTFKFQKIFLEYRSVQYSYNDHDLYYFMDTENYEQVPLSKEQLGNAVKYLKEGMTIELLLNEGQPVSVQMPVAVELKVTEAGPSYKGDTASSGSKPATIETGLVVQVPMFVAVDDIIKVDTRTGDYLERVS